MHCLFKKINNIRNTCAIQHFFFSYLDYIFIAHSSSGSLKDIDHILKKIPTIAAFKVFACFLI